MNTVKYNIAIITNIIPTYRKNFYENLILHYKNNIHIYCQDGIPGISLSLSHREFKNNLTLIKYISLKKERLGLQFLPVLKLIKHYDIIYIYGNPRIITNVVWSVFFKLIGKKIIIWGHYHTSNSNPFLEYLRLMWWNKFDNIFLYTDNEVDQFKKNESGAHNKNIIGMNNGLDQTEIEACIKAFNAKTLLTWKKNNGIYDRTAIISCARLIKKNKFDQIIDILPALLEFIPDITWCVIGSGEEESNLKKYAKKKDVFDHIVWVGEIYSEKKLSPWFLSSSLMIHPGAIGLSLMHSMGYGVPVVTHNNASKQMPEFTALVDRINGFLFEEDDLQSLITTVIKALSDKKQLKTISSNAKETVRNTYNTQVMSSRFVELTSLAHNS